MANTTKSSFSASLGADMKKIHEEIKGATTKRSVQGRLPGGIENGVAQLVEFKFAQVEADPEKKDKKFVGEWYMYCAGIVKSPTTHNGEPVRGLRTEITEMLCDTPGKKRATKKDHLNFVYETLRSFGVDTTKIQVVQLDSIAQALKKQKPYFRFRTSEGQATKQYPNPMTFHHWGEVIDYKEEHDEMSNFTAPQTNGTAKETKAAKAEQTETTAESFDDGAVDLGALAEEANGNDTDAQAKLKELAMEKGYSEEEVDDADDWNQVKDMIENPKEVETEAEVEAEEEEEEGAAPSVGDEVKYRPKNPATGKPEKKAVEVKVTKVNVDKQTVNLVGTDGKTMYKNVTWAELIVD